MKLFMSHSSQDQKFAGELSRDLTDLGHDVWLDAWKVKVGDDIVQEIEKGLEDYDYLALVLTPEAVASGWVEREWQSAFWEEAKNRRVMVFPILLRDCVVPNLLKTKKYADFRKNYKVGLVELSGAIVPIAREDRQKLYSLATSKTDKAFELLTAVQSGKPLSECISQCLEFASKWGEPDLSTFCRNELSGWPDHEVAPEYRRYEIFLCVGGVPNPSYVGWGGNTGAMFAYVEQHPEAFKPIIAGYAESVVTLEAKNARAPENTNYWHQWQTNLSQFVKDPKNPNAQITCLSRGGVFHDIYIGIKAELTKRIIGVIGKSEKPQNSNI